MASIIDFASISDSVYKDAGDCLSSFPAGRRKGFKIWKRKQVSSSKPSGQWFGTQSWAGFYGALFVNGGDAVIAFRGTEFGLNARALQDLAADLDLALGLWTFQMGHAVKFAQHCRSAGSFNRIYLTGHSLGGALALAASEKHPYTTITFNAPGMANSMALKVKASKEIHPGELASALGNCSLTNLRLNLRLAYDPISSAATVGSQAGTNLTLSDFRPRPQPTEGRAGEKFGSSAARAIMEGSMDIVQGAHKAGTTLLAGVGLLPADLALASQTQMSAELDRRRPGFSNAAAAGGGYIGRQLDSGVDAVSVRARRVAEIISNPLQMHSMESMLQALSYLEAAHIEIECGI